MAEKTPEQILAEKQKKFNEDTAAFSEEKANFETDLKSYNEKIAKLAETDESLKADRAAFEEEKANFEAAKKDTPKEEAAPKVDEEVFKKHGYLIESDLKYNKKTLKPGTRNKLSDLNKKGIQRLLDGKTISK